MDNYSRFFIAITILVSVIQVYLNQSLTRTLEQLHINKEITQPPKFLHNSSLESNSTQLIKPFINNFSNSTHLEEDRLTEWLCLLHQAGGRSLPPIVYKQEIWRFATSLFLHINWQHLLGNLLILYFVVKLVKAYYKAKNVILVFCLCGLTANIASSYYNPNELLVGLSPAVYSVFGMALFVLLKKISELSQKSLKVLKIGKNLELKKRLFLLKKIWEPLIPNLLICGLIFWFGVAGGSSDGSDVSCHALGILLGLANAYPLFEGTKEIELQGLEADLVKQRRESRRRLLKAVMVLGFDALILAFAGFYIFKIYGSDEEQLASALNMGCRN